MNISEYFTLHATICEAVYHSRVQTTEKCNALRTIWQKDAHTWVDLLNQKHAETNMVTQAAPIDAILVSLFALGKSR